MMFGISGFINYLNENLDELKRRIFQKSGDFEMKRFINAFRYNWVERKSGRFNNDLLRNVVAVDSGSYSRDTNYGCEIFLVNSFCYNLNNKASIQKIFVIHESENVEEYKGMLREIVEHEALSKFLEENDVEYAIIDGSLYSRYLTMMKGNEGYCDSLINLINLCRKKGVTLLGVSKFSRASLFLDYFCRKLIEYESIPDEPDEYLRIYDEILDRRSLSLVNKINREDIRKIIEARFKIMNDLKGFELASVKTGFSKPIIIKANPRQREVIESRGVLKYFKELPGLISFYYRPYDSCRILRVDIVDFNSRFLRGSVKISGENMEIVDLLFSLSDSSNYNVPLVFADRNARIERNDGETIIGIIEKKLKIRLSSGGFRI